MMKIRIGLTLLAFALMPRVAAAQVTTITPTNAFAFTASPDHATLDNGVARLTSYAVAFCPSAQVVSGAICPAPVVVSVGKPTPDGTNTILTPPIRSLIGPNTAWVAFAQAVGPGGTGVDPTGVGPFSYPAPPAPATSFSIR